MSSGVSRPRQVTAMGHRGVELNVQGKPVRLHIARGLTLEDGPLNQVRHHTILAHGLAVQAMRASGRPGTKIGPAENMPHALPVIDTPEHVKAAEVATRALNRYFFVPMLEGRYDEAYLKAGKDAPRFTDEEMTIIGAPFDFVGINVYIRTLLVVASAQPLGYREVAFNISHPKMFLSWHRLAPESQYWSPRLLHSLWKPKEIHVTENGCAASDVVAADGHVYDSDRLMYLRNGRMWQQRATAEGMPSTTRLPMSEIDSPHVTPISVLRLPLSSASRSGSLGSAPIASRKPIRTCGTRRRAFELHSRLLPRASRGGRDPGVPGASIGIGSATGRRPTRQGGPPGRSR